MRRYQKILMTTAFVTVFVLVGITPIVVKGQSKERTVLSREGGRDPFQLPAGIHLLSTVGTGSSLKPVRSGADNRPIEDPMKVKAILISDHARLVLIDHHIVTVGDRIRDERVLEIKKDRVTLGKGDQKRTLLLSQSPVLLTVDGIKGEDK